MKGWPRCERKNRRWSPIRGPYSIGIFGLALRQFAYHRDRTLELASRPKLGTKCQRVLPSEHHIAGYDLHHHSGRTRGATLSYHVMRRGKIGCLQRSEILPDIAPRKDRDQRKHLLERACARDGA